MQLITLLQHEGYKLNSIVVRNNMVSGVSVVVWQGFEV